MTEKDFGRSPLNADSGAPGNGAANGHDPEADWLLLDSGRVPAGNIAPREWPADEAGDDGEEGCAEEVVEAADLPSPKRSSGFAQAGPQADEPAAPDAEELAEPARELTPEFTDEDLRRHLRMGEALLFASAEPLRTEQLAERLPDGADVRRVLADLAEQYRERGVNLVRVAGGWAFRTAPDLSFLMERERVESRKLSRAALETLAIIAYHQPVTRAEIEDIRGVSVSKGTLDVLMEIGWVRVRGRRQTPGRPVTYGTSDAFLEHFGLDRVSDLPGMDELKAAGLLDTRMPTNIAIPRPSDEDADDDDFGDGEGEDAFAAEEGDNDPAPDDGDVETAELSVENGEDGGSGEDVEDIGDLHDSHDKSSP